MAKIKTTVLLNLIVLPSLLFGCGHKSDSESIKAVPVTANTSAEAGAQTTAAPVTTDDAEAPATQPSPTPEAPTAPSPTPAPGTEGPLAGNPPVTPPVTPPTVPPVTPPVVVPPVAPAGPNFAMITEKVLKPFCLRCHTPPRLSGGINLSTYASVKANVELIRTAALVEQFMPPSGPLADEPSALLQKWIDAGTPE